MRKSVVGYFLKSATFAFALPLSLAAAPLCNTCSPEIPFTQNIADTTQAKTHACCEKKSQIQNIAHKTRCLSCLETPSTPATETKASPIIPLNTVLPSVVFTLKTDFVYFSITQFYPPLSSSPPFILLKKILL
ncbi:MAG TPA: hypothetical protein PLY93_10735 [Turneriella sp.]|nr:hypothetical protein [Turneriella sp.]